MTAKPFQYLAVHDYLQMSPGERFAYIQRLTSQLKGESDQKGQQQQREPEPKK